MRRLKRRFLATVLVGSVILGVILVHGTVNSNVISSSTTVATPTFTIFWVNPPPSSALQGDIFAASFSMVNSYGRELNNYVLALNITGSGIIPSCAGLTSSLCVTVAFTSATSSTWVGMTPVSATTTSAGNPEALLLLAINVPAGTTTGQFRIEYTRAGTYNWQLNIGSTG